MSDTKKTARQFADLFTKALGDTRRDRKSKKEQESTYYHLTRFIQGLTSAQDIDACITQYLTLYQRLSPGDPRSKMIFAILLTRRIKQSAADASYLHDLRDILNQKQPSSPIWQRFDQLGPKEKSQVRDDLQNAIDNLPLASGEAQPGDREKGPAAQRDPGKASGDSSKIAKDFAEGFGKVMTAAGSTKQQEAVYYPFTRFIHKLKNPAAVDACIEKYLSLYKKLSPDDPRSKMIFAILLTQRIEDSDQDVPYLLRLKDILEQKQPSSPIWMRFDQIEDNQQNDVRGSLRKALDKSITIFDELKKAYADTHGQKQGSMAELLNFDPLPGGELEKSFRALTKKCAQAWEKCGGQIIPEEMKKYMEPGQQRDGGLTKENWEQFEAAFKDFTDFLKQNLKEKLKLFQILKWCHEPYVGAPITAISGRRAIQTVTRPVGNEIQNEFYFQTVFALFLRANRVVNPKLYQYRFSDDEEKFLLGPLLYTLHSSNYRNRLRMGASKPGGLHGASVGRIWLLLFARSKNLSVVTDDKHMQIAKIYDDVADGKISPRKLADKTFNLGQLPHLDWAKNSRIRIGTTLGAGSHQTEIVYFENEDTGYPRVYLEYTNMRKTLFELDIWSLIDRLEATPRLIIWEANKGLLVLIAEYWAFLFTMFMPGVGYFGIFLEGGFGAVIKQLVLDKVVGMVVENITDHAGISSNGGAGAAATFLFNRKKAIADRVKALENKLGRLAEKEFLAEEEAETFRLTERELKELRPQISQDERAALESEKRMLEKADADIKKIEQQKQKALELEEEKRAKDLSRNRGTSNRATPANPKVHPVERWQTAGQETPEAIRAREELAREIESRSMPKDTRVRLPQTPRTEAGRAQNLAATPKDSPIAFDRDIELDFPNKIRRELGLPLRDPSKPKLGVVGTDGIHYEPNSKYFMLEHKEVETIWQNSRFSSELMESDLKQMLQRHLDVARVLRPHGCLGFLYSTNEEEMKKLLARLIAELRISTKHKPGDWFPLHPPK